MGGREIESRRREDAKRILKHDDHDGHDAGGAFVIARSPEDDEAISFVLFERVLFFKVGVVGHSKPWKPWIYENLHSISYFRNSHF